MGPGRVSLTGLSSHYIRLPARPGPQPRDVSFARAHLPVHLIAKGLVGEPTAPVIGIAGATNMNS